MLHMLPDGIERGQTMAAAEILGGGGKEGISVSCQNQLETHDAAGFPYGKMVLSSMRLPAKAF